MKASSSPSPLASAPVPLFGPLGFGGVVRGGALPMGPPLGIGAPIGMHAPVGFGGPVLGGVGGFNFASAASPSPFGFAPSRPFAPLHHIGGLAPIVPRCEYGASCYRKSAG